MAGGKGIDLEGRAEEKERGAVQKKMVPQVRVTFAQRWRGGPDPPSVLFMAVMPRSVALESLAQLGDENILSASDPTPLDRAVPYAMKTFARVLSPPLPLPLFLDVGPIPRPASLPANDDDLGTRKGSVVSYDSIRGGKIHKRRSRKKTIKRKLLP